MCSFPIIRGNDFIARSFRRRRVVIFFDNPQNLRREAGKNLPIMPFYTCVILFFIFKILRSIGISYFSILRDKIKDETNVSIVNTRFEKHYPSGTIVRCRWLMVGNVGTFEWRATRYARSRSAWLHENY